MTIQLEPKMVLDGSLLTPSTIRAGQGLGLVPYWLARGAIADGSLVSVLEELVAGHLPIHALLDRVTHPGSAPAHDDRRHRRSCARGRGCWTDRLN
ncbi:MULTISPECIES: hypothetical protein [unclassified Novosphingobium]|uniref:hypothetical protein n=1 Tax=unclassified Novosphingobium TaxID=2644732 RepID=UPI00146F651A|nr:MULTISPECIES: hypothetical protein [unclassified Novosphingobium]NMN05464.1 DNA-binding transcriptional LysR family regulator [Novosphingobium sp. SG919]NMN88177.1 DNA-binding transcriptional LysR family regulator [Novosphingobium sp. SG916]